MNNPEGIQLSEEEMGLKKPEKAEYTKELPAEYAKELRDKMSEASATLSDIERQRRLKAEAIAQEQDMVELKKMLEEYDQLNEELLKAEGELNDAKVALETTVELGIKLPKEKSQKREFSIVLNFEDSREEMLEVLADVKNMNDLITQRENLKAQMKEAASIKDEERFNELTDSYIVLSQEIEALAKKEVEIAKKVDTITEIKSKAA